VMHTRASAALAVRADAPWKTLEEFVEAARAKPLGINLATAGPGSLWQLGSIELSHRIGTEFNYVPFPGSGPSVTALLGGHVDAVVAGVSEVRNQARAGNLRLLGVMAPVRTPLFPDVPTFKERGYDLVFQAWGGLMVPKGIPIDRRDKLAKALLKVIQGDVFRRFCSDAGLEVAPKGPEEFQQFLAGEYKAFGPIVKIAGLGISAR
jgi:tripartite-type tricarboxylate transporter receptor subunit TctC